MSEKLITKIIKDDIVEQVCKEFTYDFQDTYEFCKHNIIKELPETFGIGLIVGTSGSGKSLLLKEFGEYKKPLWDPELAICSHFDTYNESVQKLMGAGFNSIPQWLVPYNILSTGQKYRVNLARCITSNTVFDEFTSVIDRATALSLSNSLQKLIRQEKYTNVVFATVHKDIISYLQPDWVYNTDDRTLEINSKIWDMSLDTKTEKVTYTIKKHFMEV